MSCALIHNPQPISLEQLLSAREQRQAYQLKLLQQYQTTLICLGINIPGAYKLTSDSYSLFKHAVKAIESLAHTQQWQILYQEQFIHVTGAEAYWVINKKNASQIKQQLINLEEQHFLGRLWDIDVFDPLTQQALSRKMLSSPPRSCFICKNPAKSCARSQKHSLQELLDVIHNKVSSYNTNHT